MFLLVEQLDQLVVCLTYSRLLTGIPKLAVFQNLRWNSNKTSLYDAVHPEKGATLGHCWGVVEPKSSHKIKESQRRYQIFSLSNLGMNESESLIFAIEFKRILSTYFWSYSWAGISISVILSFLLSLCRKRASEENVTNVWWLKLHNLGHFKLHL